MRGWGWIVALVALFAVSAGPGFGGQPQDPEKQPPGGPAEPVPSCLCEQLCAYANATGKNTGGLGEDGEPIPPAARLEAARQLEIALRKCLSKSTKIRKGTCMCIDANGRSYPFTYAIHRPSGDAEIAGDQDVVIAMGGDSTGSTDGGNATATNSGDGDALAFGGDNCGSGDGGQASATAAAGDSLAIGGNSVQGQGGQASATSDSGDAVALGGGSGGTATGGGASASSTSGSSSAYGGYGGNAGGSPSQPGGAAGTATANFGGQMFAAAGLTPVPSGQHGVGSGAFAGPGLGSSTGGVFHSN